MVSLSDVSERPLFLILPYLASGAKPRFLAHQVPSFTSTPPLWTLVNTPTCAHLYAPTSLFWGSDPKLTIDCFLLDLKSILSFPSLYYCMMNNMSCMSCMSCMRVSASEELAALLGEVVLVSPAHAGISNTQRSYIDIPIREHLPTSYGLKASRCAPGPAALIRALRDAVQLVIPEHQPCLK